MIENLNNIDLNHRGIKLFPWPTEYDRSYRPLESASYWCPEIEKADKNTLDNIIFFKLKNIVSWAWEKSTFYKNKWKEAGVHPDILKDLSDFSKFPIVHKSDLRLSQEASPPFGDYLCVPEEEIARVHGTSGTTGKPTLFGIGRGDMERIAEAHARILWGAGLRPTDTVFIGSFFSLYWGSWGALVGCERLGAKVIPFGAGIPGQTAVAAKLIARVKPTCFYGTPSYAFRLAEVAKKEGFDPRRDFSFRIMFFSGEPGAGISSTKKQLENIFGAKVIDMGSTAEMTPWMTNAECEYRTGMHLWQDIVYTEVCDAKNFKPVPFGSEGTPVYTHLERTSQPMIRFVSGDLTVWTNEPCPCGRSYPRLPKGIYGRIDDMIIVRGVNLYPNAIEDILRSIPGVGNEYRVVVSKNGSMDELKLLVEHEGTSDFDVLVSLKNKIAEKIQIMAGLRPTVEIVEPNSLPRTEFKSKRVMDYRK
ncbi:MAG: AMP-binding protein [Patescibacteria group bacterium]